MKLYHGKWKYVRRYYKGNQIALINWALSLKPGDYFSSCAGHNRQVKSTRPHWSNDGRFRYGRTNKHWFIWSVEIIDTLNGFHKCDGSGCAMPAESNETIMNNYREWIELPHFSERMDRIAKAIKSGKSILNEHGELLTEFQ